MAGEVLHISVTLALVHIHLALLPLLDRFSAFVLSLPPFVGVACTERAPSARALASSLNQKIFSLTPQSPSYFRLFPDLVSPSQSSRAST